MKNLLSYFKLTVLSFFSLAAFIFSFYLSILSFLILMINEAINGKINEALKEDFSYYIQKVSDLPVSIFTREEKREMNWSE
ncbi:hypothetical protein [Cytophaga hutchinsonii]|jgi:hypothetical protein|uniref:Uncharacterized protein n=1 Tax=Cytophaga hutchinsonii (strain ATCC 33406 / DSM 1761 / CIP 103989 / NBRC 15051 / NCIMB 9469 / D465) TaxID=269798 RepID=A0A6N4STN7_CYTH3|nr:hypothetical protein [Cytophaga hutchinsonii]ABG59594.1 hypothetical protein CHU_2336 [Cytophaga hutchinsonii ATCC 33406]SFX67525.1 hypothetical protein SAMN04487930_107194 [Cytophaga hutchinsonii ATCC 33406]